MASSPQAPDLGIDDAEIERLSNLAAAKTSTARAAFRARLELQALTRAADPYDALTPEQLAERVALLRETLDEAALAQLVKTELSRHMSDIGKQSSRARRERALAARLARLRRGAGEA